MIIKVVSLNLWWNGGLVAEAVKFLRREEADVVLLQEVIPDGHQLHLITGQPSLEILRQELGYPYVDYAQALVLDVPQGKVPIGNAVLSKLQISNKSVTFLMDSTLDEYQDVPELFPIFPRILQHVELVSPASSINIFNMHGVWDLKGDDPSPARRQMVARTLAATEGQPNVILAGDSNASKANPVLRDIEQELISVFGQSLTTTFNMRRKTQPGYATAAVDHMYLSPNIKLLSRDCPDVDISDHLPLVATLEIQSDPTPNQ